jgi:hypothetical protein
MALLSQMIRTVAITGRTDTVNAWFADRQSGRWAEQKIAAAFPDLPGRPPADPARKLRELEDLHRRGAVTDAEFERLRAGLG